MDGALVARAQNGDEAAYRAIIEAYREPVFRLAFLILGDADDAQDVAQETFIRAWGALDRFDRARPLRPWLLRIAANLARNRRRSAGRYWAMVRRVAQQSPGRAPMLETQNVQQDESVALWRAVRRLKPPAQQVIYLRYFLDLSVEETAAALDIQPGTVKSRQHRALQQLRQIIAQDFPLLSEGRSHE
ncbi:MAG: RNA polymerase sigma factor [Anaerolineae bacterium]|nr:RNA polymerase sigma factor [Anaerolineae bacterium]